MIQCWVTAAGDINCLWIFNVIYIWYMRLRLRFAYKSIICIFTLLCLSVYCLLDKSSVRGASSLWKTKEKGWQQIKIQCAIWEKWILWRAFRSEWKNMNYSDHESWQNLNSTNIKIRNTLSSVAIRSFSALNFNEPKYWEKPTKVLIKIAHTHSLRLSDGHRTIQCS